MKRIIDGKAYNTETATKLLEAPIIDFERRVEGDGLTVYVHIAKGLKEVGRATLYQNKNGAYFFVSEWIKNELAGLETSDHPWKIVPVSRKQALTWAERRFHTEVIERAFGPIEEAGAKSGSILLRFPDTLKRRMEETAKTADQSVNAWAMRCLERCVDEAKLATADSSVLTAIDTLIRYMDDANEAKHFEEMVDNGESTENHIYRSVYTLAKWRGLNVSDWPIP